MKKYFVYIVAAIVILASLLATTGCGGESEDYDAREAWNAATVTERNQTCFSFGTLGEAEFIDTVLAGATGEHASRENVKKLVVVLKQEC